MHTPTLEEIVQAFRAKENEKQADILAAKRFDDETNNNYYREQNQSILDLMPDAEKIFSRLLACGKVALSIEEEHSYSHRSLNLQLHVAVSEQRITTVGSFRRMGEPRMFAGSNPPFRLNHLRETSDRTAVLVWLCQIAGIGESRLT